MFAIFRKIYFLKRQRQLIIKFCKPLQKLQGENLKISERTENPYQRNFTWLTVIKLREHERFSLLNVKWDISQSYPYKCFPNNLKLNEQCSFSRYLEILDHPRDFFPGEISSKTVEFRFLSIFPQGVQIHLMILCFILLVHHIFGKLLNIFDYVEQYLILKISILLNS